MARLETLLRQIGAALAEGGCQVAAVVITTRCLKQGKDRGLAGAEVNLSSHWWNLLRHRHEIRCLFAVAKGQGGEENAQDRDGIKPGKLALRRLYLDGTRVKMEPDMYEGGRL